MGRQPLKHHGFQVSRADAIERELRTQEAIREFSLSSSRTDFNEFDRLLSQPPVEPEATPELINSSTSSSSVASPHVPPTISLPTLPDFAARSTSTPSSHHPSPLVPNLTIHAADPDAEMRKQVARVFRSAAILYLYTVMSGPHPRVPEVVDAVSTIVECVDLAHGYFRL